MENTDKTEKATEYQKINSELALDAAAGNSDALGQLWQLNQGLIHNILWKWYGKHKDDADHHGITFEDLEQESFFAIKAAVDHYDPDKWEFTTILAYYIKSQIYSVLYGDHRRTIFDEQGQKYTISGNPLNSCASLDMPIGLEESDSILLDVQQDQTAITAFESAEDEIYKEQLHDALEEALDRLPAKKSNIIRAHYYKGKTFKKIAAELGISQQAAQAVERECLCKMKKFKSLEKWHDDIISRRSWRGTGLTVWKQGGSVEERIIEYLDSRGLLYPWQIDNISDKT